MFVSRRIRFIGCAVPFSIFSYSQLISRIKQITLVALAFANSPSVYRGGNANERCLRRRKVYLPKGVRLCRLFLGEAIERFAPPPRENDGEQERFNFVFILFLPYRLLICFTFITLAILACVGYFNVMLFHSVFHHVLVSMFG